MKTPTKCDCQIIHHDIVDEVKKQIPKKSDIDMLSNFYSALKDPTRLKILHALFVSKMCVCDIAALLNMTQSAISHQLKVLKTVHLVDYDKQGKVVYYFLKDDHIRTIINQSLKHIKE